MPVYIAIYLADIQTPWVKSLKEKRSVIKPVTEKLKQKFPVSVARLDGLNAYGWERVGVTAIHADRAWLESLLSKIHHFVAAQSNCDVQIIDSVVEVWDVSESA